MSNHLTEPLDYLYEELPPERMAEARRHLAVCPDCRARVRDIRETVKLYRQIPRPAAPAGLAARAASRAIAAAKAPASAKAAEPEAIVLATPTPARARIPATDASERRQTKLEEDFERLKQEVKEEMRRGWRQWFFHPAWTIAASALLVASLAIHYSPRERYDRPIRLSESAIVADAARDLRNRERIPAPEPLLAGAAAGAAVADDPNQPVTSTPLPPAPAVLRAANARRDLPLPFLARMRPQRPETIETAEIAQADAAPTELAFAETAPVPLPPAAPMAAPAPAKLSAAQPPAAAPAIPNAPAEVAAAESAPAFDETAASASPSSAAAAAPAPAQSGEITPVLTPDELASLAAAPVETNEENTAPAVIAMTEMTPPQIVDRPEGFDTAERVRTLSALAGMQIASGEIADAWKTVEMLRRYSPAAAEELSALITEAEKAALEKEAPGISGISGDSIPISETEIGILSPDIPDMPAAVTPVDPEPPVSEPVPEPAPAVPVAPEPAAAPAPVPPFPGAMIEPPEDPPMSMVIVPAYMQPAEAEPVISAPAVPVPAPDAALRETLDPSRSAELARTLRQSLDPVIPLQVYIRPVVPAVPAAVAPPASVPAAAPVYTPVPESEPVPEPAPKKQKRKRSGNTPYLRDY